MEHQAMEHQAWRYVHMHREVVMAGMVLIILKNTTAMQDC